MTENTDNKSELKTENEGIVKHSIWLSVLVCIGKVLGFVKQSVIAWAFGAGTATDTYYAADGYSSLVGHVLGQSVGPTVLTGYMATTKEEGSEKGNNLLYESLCFFSLLGVVLIIISAILSGVISKVVGLSYGPEQLAELQKMIIALCPVMIFAPVSGVCSAYLDANKRFTHYKLCSLFFSISISISVLLLHERLGIWSLVLGFVGGYFLHMLYMLFVVRGSMKIRFKNPFGDPRFKRLLKAFVPMVIGNSVVDLGYLVDRVVASSLVTGSVSILFYGQVVSGDLVNAVVITTVGTVLLTSFTNKVTGKTDNRELGKVLQKVMSSLSCIICAISALYFVEGKDLIRLFFERGSFNSDDTEKVFIVACAYSIGFIFMALREVLVKAHYAFMDTFSPMINSLVGLGANLICSLVLSRYIGVYGVAIATTASMLVVTCMSFITIKKHLGFSLFDISFALNIGKSIVSMIVSVVLARFCFGLFEGMFVLLRMVIVAFLTLMIYVILSLLLKEKTVVFYSKMIIERLSKKRR